LAAIFGVGGARLFYVIHYWDNFARQPHPLLSVINFRQGGLEFLGGFVCATLAILIYLLAPRRQPDGSRARAALPIRLYLDVLSPSLIWGLAITRIGCFFNGCCFGGVCVAAGTDEPKFPWAMRFPYSSPPFVRQWEEGRISVPNELTFGAGNKHYQIPLNVLNAEPGRGAPRYLASALQNPSRADPSQKISVAELRELASGLASLPIHPTQLYAMVNAFLLSGFLSGLFWVRKRDGVVFAAMLVLYGTSRIVLEMVRTDNPHDTFGLTASQFVSVIMIVLGVILSLVLYAYFPEQSPGAPAGVRARSDSASRGGAAAANRGERRDGGTGMARRRRTPASRARRRK